MACGLCQGQEIDFKDLRTPEQKEAIASVWAALKPNIGKGATPYGGMLNAPYDPAQMAAINMMYQVGGMQQPYQPFMYPPGGMQQAMGGTTPFNQEAFRNMQEAVQRGGQRQFGDDPYNPWNQLRQAPKNIVSPWGPRRRMR